MSARTRSVRELMAALLEEPTFTVDETAVLLSLSRVGTYEAVKSGEVPSLRFGRCIRVPTSELRKMLGIERREPAFDPPRLEAAARPSEEQNVERLAPTQDRPRLAAAAHKSKETTVERREPARDRPRPAGARKSKQENVELA